MLRTPFLAGALLAACSAFAQNVGINNPNPAPSALLDLTSTDRGLLVPRMATGERDAIPLPATSLLIFNTTNARFEYFDGTAWVALLPGWGLAGNTGIDPATNFLGTTDNQPLAFRTNDTEHVRVLGNGNVGIGTNAPTERLEIAGRTLLHTGFSADNAALVYRTTTDYMFLGPRSGSAAGGGAVALYGTTNAVGLNPGGIDLNTASGNLRILSNGNVGIGTSAPQRKLHVSMDQNSPGTLLALENTNTTNNNGTVISFRTATTGAGATPFSELAAISAQFPVHNHATASSSLLFHTQTSGVAAERMRIHDNGNVGIGTAAPADRLHVAGKIRMVDGTQAAGSVLTGDANGTASWTLLSAIAAGTLDQAYDFGGAGLGRAITADAGAVMVQGVDGFVSTGTLGSGTIPATGTGTRMMWYPRKAAFRAGNITGAIWDDVNIAFGSVAFGNNTTASGSTSAAWGDGTTASGSKCTAWGVVTTASGNQSTAWGASTTAAGNECTAWGTSSTATGVDCTAWGLFSTASGNLSTAWGERNTAPSFGETVLGIGATTYTPSVNGTTQFRAANAGDRLFVVGNAIDANSNGMVDLAERSNALVILKNGNTGIGTTTPDQHAEVEGAGAQYLRVTSTSGATGIAGIELKRSTVGAFDWQVRNEGGILLFGQSIDDLATVADVLRLGGGSVTPAADNVTTCGQAALRWTNIFATSGVVNTSDARDKTDIRALDYGLAEVMRLRPVRFRWQDSTVPGEKLGLIAQELQKVLPETVVDSTWHEQEDGTRELVPAERLGVYYSDIIPVLVKAIQEQQAEIEALRALLEGQRNR